MSPDPATATAAASSTAPSNKDHDDDDKNEGTKKDSEGQCLYGAVCCCYTACDMKNVELCCRYEYEYCCVRHGCCVSITSKPLGCGMTTNKEQGDCCKLAAYCCDIGCVKPTACCSSAHACLCCYKVTSFPCSERFLDKCVCACCFLACTPKCGCCVAPPTCPALLQLRNNDGEMEPMKMDRGDGDDYEEAGDGAAPPEEAPVEAAAEVIPEKEKGETAEEAHA